MPKKISKPNLIPLVETPISALEADNQALDNLAKINRNGGLKDAKEEFMDEVFRTDVLPKAKMNRLKKIADKINAIVTPVSACRSGCSHCCNISAVMSRTEATSIGALIGKKPKDLLGVLPDEDSRMKWFRNPCPFLIKGRCSVYSERPLACRLMFNLADNPYFCNTDIPPAESHVTMVNLKDIENAYVKAFLTDGWGDIRDFFPPAKSK